MIYCKKKCFQQVMASRWSKRRLIDAGVKYYMDLYSSNTEAAVNAYDENPILNPDKPNEINESQNMYSSHALPHSKSECDTIDDRSLQTVSDRPIYCDREDGPTDFTSENYASILARAQTESVNFANESLPVAANFCSNDDDEDCYIYSTSEYDSDTDTSSSDSDINSHDESNENCDD